MANDKPLETAELCKSGEPISAFRLRFFDLGSRRFPSPLSECMKKNKGLILEEEI